MKKGIEKKGKPMNFTSLGSYPILEMRTIIPVVFLFLFSPERKKEKAKRISKRCPR